MNARAGIAWRPRPQATTRARAPSRLTVLVGMLCLWVAPRLAHAQNVPDSTARADRPVTLRISLKGSGVFARWPDNVVLFPSRGTSTGFWRARIEPTFHLRAGTSVEVAYEQRVRASSSASALGVSAALPPDTEAPYRVRPLDWSLHGSDRASWRHEIDRAALHTQMARTELTIGRQAIGWGRGVMFGAIDLFSPFTPLEADREWRRGVDAVRADVKVSDRSSLDIVGAFGRTMGESAAGARLRGYAGNVDVEAVAGWRAGDRFAGVSTSGAVHGAELHAEVAAFATPAVSGSTAFGRARTIAKLVAGGSYRLPIAGGIFAELEYHYSGFGAPTAADLTAWLADVEFQRRYVRGDTQMLSRHALAALARCEISPLVSVAGQWVHSPIDHSGVAIPSLTLTASDRWSAMVNGYLPYGRQPIGGTLRSEYGQAPLGLFVQVRFDR